MKSLRTVNLSGNISLHAKLLSNILFSISYLISLFLYIQEVIIFGINLDLV